MVPLTTTNPLAKTIDYSSISLMTNSGASTYGNLNLDGGTGHCGFHGCTCQEFICGVRVGFCYRNGCNHGRVYHAITKLDSERAAPLREKRVQISRNKNGVPLHHHQVTQADPSNRFPCSVSECECQRFNAKRMPKEEDPDGVLAPLCTCRHAVMYHTRPVEETKSKGKGQGKKKKKKKSSKKKRRR